MMEILNNVEQITISQNVLTLYTNTIKIEYLLLLHKEVINMARKKLKHVYIVTWVGELSVQSYTNIFRKKVDAMCYMIINLDEDEFTEEELKMTDDDKFDMIEEHNVYPLSNCNLIGSNYFKLEKLLLQ